MVGHGQKLTRKQGAAIAALLSTPTYAEAAAKAGIGEATLYRWLRLPEFRAAYQEARRRLFDRALDGLLQVSRDAVATLGKNLDSRKAADQNRAAIAILDQFRRGNELGGLAERLDHLEAIIEGRSNGLGIPNQPARKNGVAD